MFYVNLIVLIVSCADLVVKESPVDHRIVKTNSYKWNLYILLYLFYQLFGDPHVRTSVVDLHQGSLRGQYSYEFDYKMYLGIRYAAIPERFQPPKEPKPWSNVQEATEEGNSCAQIFMVPHLNWFTGSEDCLFLNIFTPHYTTSRNKLPVMLYIHGGGFRYGSGDRALFSPQYIVRHNVIVVTINYRLGAFGFLSLGIEGAYGNAGLKDQLAAMKWVKRNIAAFGGDGDNLTIFGESAGGSSVAFHIMSPQSTGMFKRAIIQSGSPLSPWSFSYHPMERVREVLKSRNVQTDNAEELLRVFKEMTTKELTYASGELHIAKLPFKPCAEVKHDGAFLTETPYTILSSGNFSKVPIIGGFNDAEGIMFSLFKPRNSIFGLQYNSINFKTEDDAASAYQMVDNFYFTNTSNEAQANIDFYSDALITAPSIYFYRLLMEHKIENLYNYYFTYNGFRNYAKLVIAPLAKGASHADELFYLFEIKPRFRKPFLRDIKVVDTFTELWTNFAKYSEPTPPSSLYKANAVEWKPSSRENLHFLQIDEQPKMIPLPGSDRMKFWGELYNKYGFKQ